MDRVYFYDGEGLRPLAITFMRVALELAVVSCLPGARRGSLASSERVRVALLGVLWLALPLSSRSVI